MNVCTREVLKQTYSSHFRKEVYICSVNFSRTIYLIDFITYTLQIKYYMVKTFHVFHYGNIFLSWLNFFLLTENHKTEMFFNKEYGTFEHGFFIPFIIVVGTARL